MEGREQPTIDDERETDTRRRENVCVVTGEALRWEIGLDNHL